MSEASNGPVAVEVNVGAEGEGEGGHVGEVAASEALEPLAEAAVEVARIEADRDTEIARIEADTSLEHHELNVQETEALNELSEKSELEQCRTRIAELEGQNTVLLTELALLKPPTPPQSEEPPPNQPDQPESVEAVLDPEREESPAPEPEKPRRKPHRWI